MNKVFMFALLFFFNMALISASGLVLNSTGFEVNKTSGTDVNLNIIIKNDEAFPFYNVTFEGNPYITMPKYSKIDPGQTVNLTAIVNGQQDFNGNLKIKGFYYTDIGEQNKTHNVDVYPYYSQPCTFSIIKGDSISWKSHVLNQIQLKKHPSEEPVEGVTMNNNETRQRKFNTVGDFEFRWFVGSWGFNEICTITVLDSTGYVNDPQLDANFHLDLNIMYEPTTVTANILDKDFNMDFFRADEGLMSVTNTGSNIAKNVTLYSDWIVFNENYFDLEPGTTNSLSFSVKPKGIATTNMTNKTYVKELIIKGNFDTINESITIFIKHADIGNGSSNATNFLDWICSERPDLCSPNVEYVYITNDSAESMVPITREQWRDYNLDLSNEKEERKILDNYVKSILNDFNTTVGKMSEELTSVKEEVNDLKTESTTSQQGIISFIILFLLLAGVVIVFLLIKIYKMKNKREEYERWD